MSNLMKEIAEHQARMQEDSEGVELGYEALRAMGLLHPVTFRLPQYLIAQLDLLLKFGPWESRNQLVFSIFDSAIQEFLDTRAGESVKEAFAAAVDESLKELRAKESA